MNQNGKVFRELVKFVKEQRKMNVEVKQLLKDHEKWMRTHEVRLTLQYGMIRELRDKLR